MGVLQDFERRLEGAVDGFFARIFRSGVQPIELARGLQSYARDAQTVHQDGVVVPNVYRFTLNAKDAERLRRLGVDLPRELAAVVSGTAREKGWVLRGPALVRVREGDVPIGKFDVQGRIEAVTPSDPPPSAPPRSSAGAAGPGAPPRPTDDDAQRTSVLPSVEPGQPQSTGTGAARPRVRVVGGDANGWVDLSGKRLVCGRADHCDVVLRDSTVSREHAALVRRASGWWVVDQGSMNGTKVNGRLAGEHQLQDGDTIELGEAALEFRED